MEHVNFLVGYLKNVNSEDLVNYLKGVKIDKKIAAKITAASFLGIGVLYLGKIWNSYRFFKKRGIKTPNYRFFFGNIEDIKRNYTDSLVEWTKIYGKTYGYYEGHLPVLVTSDLEIIDEIFFKLYSNFSARKKLPQQLSDHSPDVNVFSAAKNRWKRLRTISNPTFSPAKLKELLPTMKICSDRLISILAKNTNKDTNISELLDRMAMDVVWNCVYGIDVDIQKNFEFNYYVKIKALLEGFASFDIFHKLTTYFYEIKPMILITSGLYSFLISKLSDTLGNPFFWLMWRVHEIIDERINENKNKNNENKSATKFDYVQILMDAEADRINLDFDNVQYESSNAKLLEKKMTRQEILASLLGFMIAGYDTTSSTLNFCFYVLINHPEELTKLQEEIDTLSDYSYESLNKLEYLDMFIKEVQRMYPVANTVQNRRCTKATTLKGINIPVDLLIAIDVLSLHYDPENWPGVDPNVFYPLRFASGAKYNKLAYMPFGAGARICIGMKFALMEIKLTLAKVIKNFEISPAKLDQQRLTIRDGDFTVRKFKTNIHVNFKQRS